jgi:hypothetical protein
MLHEKRLTNLIALLWVSSEPRGNRLQTTFLWVTWWALRTRDGLVQKDRTPA